MLDPDVELMQRAGQDDEVAFRQLFSRHIRAVVAFAYRFFHNRAVAEEVAQEVFLRVYRARKNYEPRAKFTTWLYTIATRACLNTARKTNLRQAENELAEEELGNAANPTPTGEESLCGRQLEQVVQQVLASLSENQRAAFILVRFGGKSYEEVGEILSLSLPAVKSLLFRGTQAVRSALERSGWGEAMDEETESRRSHAIAAGS